MRVEPKIVCPVPERDKKHVPICLQRIFDRIFLSKIRPVAFLSFSLLLSQFQLFIVFLSFCYIFLRFCYVLLGFHWFLLCLAMFSAGLPFLGQPGREAPHIF